MSISEYMSSKIVFPHVMKTAGTSLIGWIQRHYNIDEILAAASGWYELRRLPPKALEGKRLVRGHFGSRILNVFGEHNGFTPIALLRDPIERVISHYWHLKFAPDAGFEFARAESFSIEAFLDHPATRYIVSNYQTANLSAVLGEVVGSAATAGPSDEVAPIDMGRAKSFLDRCAVVGTTEELSTFVAALSRRFCFWPDDALLRHRSYRRVTSYGDEIINKIRALNEADYELYHYARARAAQTSTRVSSVPARNPNTVGPDGAARWRAGMPYWGRGWSDAVVDERGRHMWSQDNVATLEFDVRRGSHCVLCFSILRFVVGFQRECFSVLVEDREVPVIPVAQSEAEGPQTYAVALGCVAGERVRIGFKINTLVSFNEVNQADSDQQKRGMALLNAVLLAYDAQPVT